ncbi:ribosomal RNA small subunit methyltransferase D [Thalassotalea insulae]|uniref:Ribosomal RNA small subunit methyltransferase D n=1 Tax=Thalassotalea insulae TaxID=2056778 RepID=A0ABQ6GR71_9GAMM|nr:16S rRNA (guanine(966)-N(2))-methyltransferase RsmD [Thalassotalea insulae]GLX78458.1 ribosomal RNA small subunit methyltransferase D [Thalassotalea insulae]
MRKSKNRSAKPEKNRQPTGNIRIIAGKHRGRKLPVLAAEGLRPTTDRVKETLFNWLMPYINQSRCLDCFAGAGSLGFEAHSRNAAHVTFVELDRIAAKQLSSNKTLLNAENIEIKQTNILSFLSQQATTTFNLVFIDPPFRQGLVEQTVELLQHGWLANDALIYIEMENENDQLSLPNNWSLLKEKNAGQVSYRLYQASH